MTDTEIDTSSLDEMNALHAEWEQQGCPDFPPADSTGPLPIEILIPVPLEGAFCTNVEPIPPPVNSKQYSHYFKKIPASITHIDIYRLCDLFEVGGGPVEHAIKKLLCAGARGSKSRKTDILEALDSLQRSLEMITEDEESKEWEDSL